MTRTIVRTSGILALALAALGPMAGPVFAQAQRGTVTGQVTDESTTRPLAGVVIRVEGTALNTITNAEGRYVLPNVPEGTQELRANLIGFSSGTQTATVVSDETVVADFALQTAAIALDQIVVTGTAGQQVRRAEGAQIASISAAEVRETAPVTSVAEVLTARTPGVSVTGSSGSSGTAQHIRIRGVSSASLSNEPLVVIDGVVMDSRITGRGFGVGGQQTSRLNDISPADIESIEVVKGPAAATLYGADASTGVIQIITKRGQVGTEGFEQTISLESNWNEANFDPPDNYAACREQDIADPDVILCAGRQVGDLVQDNPLVRDDVLRTGTVRAVHWSGRGGGQNYGFYVSLGMEKDDGTLPNNFNDRYNGRINFNFTPHPLVRVDAGYGFSLVKTGLPDNDNNSLGYMAALLGNPRTVREDGSGANGWFGNGRNADAIAALENNNDVLRNIPTLTVEHTPLPWFSHRITGGADISRSEALAFTPRTPTVVYSSAVQNGRVIQTTTNFDSYTLDYLANLTGRFGQGDWISTDLSVGAQLLDRREEWIQAQGDGLVNNSARAVSAAAERIGTQEVTWNRRVGFLAQLQTGFSDTRYLTIGARIDRSSTFGTDADWIFLPKVSGSWVISDESFWRGSLGPVSSLRLRSAYGVTGRAPTPGASLQTFDPAAYAVTGTTVGGGIIPLNFGNLALKPERGSEFEAGLDAGLFGERVGLELTYFNKISKDLLLRRPLSPSLGFDEDPWANIGEVVNRGFEVALDASLLQLPNVGWDARLSFNTLHNEITDLGGVEPFNVTNAMQRQAEGEQLGAFHARKIREVITSPGDERCPFDADQDTNVPCTILGKDLEPTGNFSPTFEGSFSSGLTLFQNLRLNAQVDWKTGHTLFNNTAFFRETQLVTSGNRLDPDALPLEEQLRRWGPFVSEDGGSVSLSNETKQAYHEDADFAKLREVSLTYQLPEHWAGMFRARGASITVGGRNLYTWTGYSGADPEVISSVSETGNTQWLRQDFLTLPQARRWMTRVNLTF